MSDTTHVSLSEIVGSVHHVADPSASSIRASVPRAVQGASGPFVRSSHRPPRQWQSRLDAARDDCRSTAVPLGERRCRTAHWQWLRKRWRRRAQRWTLRHRRCSTRSTARSKAARRQGRRCVRTADALSPPAASGFAAASAHTVAGVQLCNGRAREMLLDVFNTDEPADCLLHRLRRWQKQQHSHHCPPTAEHPTID